MAKRAKELNLPEEEIVKDYESNSWFTIKRLAKKYNTTSYYISKVLKKHNVKTRVKEFTEEQIESFKSKPKKDDKVTIVKRFIKPERLNSTEDVKNHIKLLEQILNKYPNKDFWLTIKLKFKLNSFAWFFTEQGKITLKQKYNIFHTDFKKEKQNIKLSQEKVGEDIISRKKYRNLKEFLLND